jgi:hypothetical protein
MNVSPRVLFLAALLAGFVLAPTRLPAQEPSPQKQVRTYVPADEVVSFPAETPFDQFVDSLSTVFEHTTGKRLVDLAERKMAIGVEVEAMQFLDALELVLSRHNLAYRETKRYFFIEEQRRR